MKQLFVAGCPRSGTTGLTNYLNRHEGILVCRERYKYVAAQKIIPELFTAERIANYEDNETNVAQSFHAELVSKKDWTRLEWVGDKYPFYTRRLEVLKRNNPEARFLVTYRCVEDVAESFSARAQDPEDSWPEKNGFEASVDIWNDVLHSVRAFIEQGNGNEVLVVDYDEFFDSADDWASLICNFLELDTSENLSNDWRAMSRSFNQKRRKKQVLIENQRSYIEKNKDMENEAWFRKRIEGQWRS